MNEFAKRILVAVILIPIVLFIVFSSFTWLFAAGLYLIIIFGNREIVAMLKAGNEPVSPVIALLGSLFVPVCFIFNNTWMFFSFVLVALFLIVFLMKLFSPEPNDGTFRYVSINLFAAIFFPFLMSFLWLIRNFQDGALWILALFVGIWLADAMAYIVGTKIGKHKIVPKVSPKKSLEGFIAGIIFGVAGIIVVYYLFLAPNTPMRVAQIAIIAIDVVLAGILGDLFESMLKRDAGVKDSGNLLPGHGGIYDRVDSLVFSAPVLFIYLQAWG